MVSLEVIQKSVNGLSRIFVLHETVIKELGTIADKQNVESQDLITDITVYMLGLEHIKVLI